MLRLIRLKPIAYWWPVAIAIAYIPVFLWRLPGTVERLYWDSDASVAAVIADTSDRGTTVLSHYGWYAYFWLTQITRPLPFHRQMWEYGPYLLFVISMSALAYVTYRLAGKWAGFMTGAAAIAISPFLAYIAVSLNFHTTTWIGTVASALFVFWVCKQTPSIKKSAVIGLLGSIFLGIFLASDPLFQVVGLVPVLVIGVWLSSRLEHRRAGVIVVAAAVVSVAIGLLISEAMHADHFSIYATRSNFAEPKAFIGNFGRLIQLVVMLPGGDKFYGQPLGERSALAFVAAAIMIAGIACPFVALRQSLNQNASIERISYCAFWSAGVLAMSCAYVFTDVGAQPGYYAMAIYYGVIATAPLLVNGVNSRKFVVAGAVGLTTLGSLLAMINSSSAYHSDKPAIASVATDIEKAAAKAGVTKGYADYWQAPGITWHSDSKLLVAPVSQCHLPDSAELCPFGINVSSEWYKPGSGGSFLLQDKDSMFMQKDPPQSFGKPSAIYVLAPKVTMYVYSHDIARQFDYSNARWKQS